MPKKIVVVGLGYVGFPLAIILAKSGYKVVGVEINRNILNSLNKGISHIREKDIQDLFREVKKNLKCQERACHGDVFIISVQTPLDKRTNKANISFVTTAFKSILPYVKKGNLIILESTVPPLTIKNVIIPLIEEDTQFKVGKDIYLAYCPERVLPGNIIYEIINNDRIIGGVNEKSSLSAKEIYSTFVRGNIYLTDIATAEFTKLIENTYRDVNIALANEFSLIGETLGIDINRAIELANKHPRVNIHRPGIGVGGDCIPVCPRFIIESDRKNSVLISIARNINEKMPYKTAEKIKNAVKSIEKPRIILLGLTYKPDVADIRMSPSFEVAAILKSEGYDVKTYDPLLNGYDYVSIKDVVEGADCLVILVGHSVIKDELSRTENVIKAIMRHPIIMKF